ncbi:MAG TPA: glycine zipper 2TM domain-containing protein [Casimicrobiaceae bacterium]|nr:glycine zipper 2TM domain-containing protein [Casimicrobiaceae bacterium]
MTLRAVGLFVLASAALLGGCAYPEPYTVYERPVVAQRTEYGVVEAIDLYHPGSRAPIGLGAIIGGVAGGIIGHQFGSGSGNTAATIAGALGGAAVGNEVQRSDAADRYRVIVRLDSGGTLALDQVGQGELRVGDRVRIVNGRVYRY